MDEAFWKRCSSCKKEIPFAASYYVCNVSTCNRRSMLLAFCSLACWDVHVPVLRHRESWAIEKEAPTRAEWERESAAAAADEPRGEPAHEAERRAAPDVARRPDAARAASPANAAPAQGAASAASGAAAAPAGAIGAPAPAPLRDARDIPRDVLVVASKLKQYVRLRSGMNTSDGVLEVLSDRLRSLCDQAIRRANEAGRKTVLDRDF